MERDYKYLREMVADGTPLDVDDIADKEVTKKGVCVFLTWTVNKEMDVRDRSLIDAQIDDVFKTMNDELQNMFPGKLRIWDWRHMKDHMHMVIYTTGSSLLKPLLDEVADKIHFIVTGEDRVIEGGQVGLYEDAVLMMLTPNQAIPYLKLYLDHHNKLHKDMTLEDEIKLIKTEEGVRHFVEFVRDILRADGVEIFGDKNPIDEEYVRFICWTEGQEVGSEFYNETLNGIRELKKSVSKLMPQIEAQDKPHKLN